MIKKAGLVVCLLAFLGILLSGCETTKYVAGGVVVGVVKGVTEGVPKDIKDTSNALSKTDDWIKDNMW